MRVHSMPDTCTARHFYDFPKGWEVYEDYNKRGLTTPYNKEWYENEVIQPLRRQLHEQLNSAKRARIVSVFAFLTGQQESVGDLLVKEFGFERTFDAHNYKYPNSSRRLFMYSRDMNDWEDKPQEKITTNPFAAPTAVYPSGGIPTIIPEGRRSHTAGVTVYTQQNNDVVSVRALRNLNATVRGGSVLNTNDLIIQHPYPYDRWVAIPEEMERVPPLLQGQRVDVLLYDGRVERWKWNTWTGGSPKVVAVKRIRD